MLNLNHEPKIGNHSALRCLNVEQRILDKQKKIPPFADDDYGPGGIERFKAKAYSNGICVAQKYVLSPRSRQSDYETTVRKMMSAVRPTGARVIVAYLEKTILIRFLHTLKYLNAAQKFLILARFVNH